MADITHLEAAEVKPLEGNRSKVVFFGNEFPSDDLKLLFRRLHRHSKDRRFRLLSAFIQEATLVLKDEISKLPQLLQDQVPHFESVLTLAEHGDFRQGGLGAAMESALLVVLQLGTLIGAHEAEDIELNLDSSPTTLAGLSIGLFAAAAVALSNTLADVLRNGAESLRVSFRLGVYVDDFSRKLEAPQPDATPQSWAHVVTGMEAEDVQAELSKYNAESGGPELTKIFISAADNNSVSISGPPSRIKEAFQRSHALRYSKSFALPVYDGLCHAPHIYGQEDISAVLGESAALIPPSRPVRHSLLSSRSGKPFTAATAGELFEEISTELITGTIYLDNITANIIDRIGSGLSGPPHELQVDTFRTSIVFKGIMETIQAAFPEIQVKRNDFIDWIYKDFGHRRPSSHAYSKLAIVGMSCRMPGGSNDLEEFWELLEQGRDAHTTVPEDRFDLDAHYDPSGKTENATQTRFGNFIDRPGFFDAAFFTMSPKEAKETDPMQRLALVTAYEAMEMAGVVPGRTPSTRSDRIGVYYGQASDDWRELNASQNIGTYAVPGGVRGFATGRINYFFKFSGPSFNIDTACSSSMAAVHAGCSALWAGEADSIIAGGLNVITDPDNYAGLCNAHFLSKTGQCKVWDKDADGYCRSDGIGSIVIKRLEDAEADNDNILAVILSAATNHSAEAISITHPHAGAQRDNYRQVLRKAGVNPLDVSYIEMHGTGTQAGDAIESESVLDVFAPLTPRRRPDQRLHLGAVKANIGHGEAAAGISSLIKTLLCFQKEQLPPHIGIKTEINPTIPKDLERRNVGLDMALTPWPREAGKKRLALVNSFGAHGGNTTLLLEDGPEKRKSRTSNVETRSMHPIIISAKSKKSLQANLENIISYLEKNPETDLSDLSYTLCGRRMHHPLRIATTAGTISGLQKFLRSSLENEAHTKVWPVPSDAPPVVFTFTGQGSTSRGIRQDLFDDSPFFQGQVLQLDRLVQRLGFPSVVPAITGSSEEDVDSPVTSQLSIVVLEIALARYWSLLGVRPSAVIGHSLGEYSALAVAGVLSVVDVLNLVGRRAQLTEKLCVPGSHSMLSVAVSPADLDEVLRSDAKTAKSNYTVSCRNTYHDTVIGGPKEEISIIRQTLEKNSYKCVLLDIPFAFHTAQMDAILDELENMAEKVHFKAPSIPVLSTLLGSVVFDGKTINAEYIRNQTRGTVRFADAVEAAQDLGMVDEKTLWVECGPHPVCVSFVRRLMPPARVAASCRRNEENMTTIAKSLVTLHLAGVTPCWHEYFKPHEPALSLIINLPKYSWNETNYWIPYLGTWTLDKALLKYGGQFLPSGRAGQPMSIPAPPAIRSSLIHQVLYESIEATKATMHVLSDMQHPDFLAAVWGHKMNNCGVATSSIWTDMALTMGDYLYRRLVPQVKKVNMNVSDLEVLHAQVASKTKGCSQPIKLETHLDLDSNSMSLAWFNVSAETGECSSENFASAVVRFEDPLSWKAEWDRVAHLVLGRIEALQQMAVEGKANQLSKNMAYTLFKNVVDYADKYRGIDTMVLHEYEAFANVTLTSEDHGTYHTPPHWIDPVCHLAGLIMNGSDASNTRDYFYVTPGSDSFRLLKPLEAGVKYQSYVRMFPLPVEAGSMQMHAGDVYILRDQEIVGVLSQIRFRRVPRLLMDRFFSAPSATAATLSPHISQQSQDPHHAIPVTSHTRASELSLSQLNSGAGQSNKKPVPVTATALSSQPVDVTVATAEVGQGTPSTTISQLTPPPSEGSKADQEETESSLMGQCLRVIADETNLELADLTPDALFAQLGVDSLMSLVLSEKFRSELGIEIKSSLFLECPSIGEMKDWVEQNC
ncbi:type I polyketide synthase [Aspergillus foveolatus]|uniref:type I polyketide synthase n=1 Tax=Aspergillus foveolatus TaxID=210207 RepID=UPI003CCD9DCB